MTGAPNGLRRGRPRYRVGYVAEVFQYIAAQQRRNHYRPVNIALSIACRDLRMSKRMWLRMVRILEAAGWLSRSAKTGGIKNPGALYWLRDLPTGAYPPSPNGHNPGAIRERSSAPGDNDPIRRELWPPDPAGAQAFDPRIQTPHPGTTLANVPYITSERSQLGARTGDSEIESAGLNVPELPLKVALSRIPERSLGERSSPPGDSLPPPPAGEGSPSPPIPSEQGGDPTPNPSPGRGPQPSKGIPVRVYGGEDFTIPRSGVPAEIRRDVHELFRQRGVRGWRELPPGDNQAAQPGEDPPL